MEPRIKNTLKEIKYHLDYLKKHEASLINDIVWDTDNEIMEDSYIEDEIIKDAIKLFNKTKETENVLEDIQREYQLSIKTEEKKEDDEEENDEEIDLPF